MFIGGGGGGWGANRCDILLGEGVQFNMKLCDSEGVGNIFGEKSAYVLFNGLKLVYKGLYIKLFILAQFILFKYYFVLTKVGLH